MTQKQLQEHSEIYFLLLLCNNFKEHLVMTRCSSFIHRFALTNPCSMPVTAAPKRVSTPSLRKMEEM